MSPALRHPVAVVALALLIFNDHWAKAAHPGWITGKLSDLAGLVFFPLLLLAILDAPRWLSAAHPYERDAPYQRRLGACLLATGLVFSAINLWQPATDAYALTLAVLKWLLHAVPAGLSGQALGPLRPPAPTLDPTDLLTLPALGLAWWIGK